MNNIKVKIKRTCNIGTLKGIAKPKGKQFSEVFPFYSVKNYRGDDGGVLQHLNIDELKDYINHYEKGKRKDANGFLKGIYRGGTNSTFCVRNSEYLFYDIDIKENNENRELFKDQHLRNRLVRELKKYSVLLGRSNSGIGIFGVIHVKNLQLISDTTDHRFIAEYVYKYISARLKEQDIPVNFDPAQGKYRQIRFVAYQKNKIKVNNSALTITYKLLKEEQEIIAGAPDFNYSGLHNVAGSVRDKFNKDNPIETLLPAAGLTLVSGNRYKYELSNSSTSGEVKDGIYINNSTTFSNKNTYFDSFAMAVRIKKIGYSQMYAELRELGYKDDEQDLKKIKAEAKNTLTPKQIFELCYPMRYKSYKDKLDFLQGIDPEQRDLFEAYLNIKKIRITYDEVITIKKWVSEKIDVIFNRADEKRKIIVASETGTGKSTAILRNFHDIRPEERLLFIAPLTAIVDQLSDGVNFIGLKGGANEALFKKADDSTIVIATHEQATKILKDKGAAKFDYIIRDEIHSDIVGSSFKSDVIGRLNQAINKYDDIPVIGLTGTPLSIFKEKGLQFHLIKIDSGKPPNKIIQRTDNREPVKTIVQHQKGVKGKAIYRANSKNSLNAVRRHLVKSGGYSYSDIKILDASKEVKGGETFRKLVEKSVFDDKIKIVLTTSVIDEGVSIKNNDFTDIVFIDMDYHPRPEPLKQFLNRFRNTNEDTKYYHYRHTPEEQNFRQYTKAYNDDISTLKVLVKDADFFDYTTHKSFVSNDSFYLEDGNINYYYLAYKNTRNFFKVLNNAEFIEFVEANYNIEIMEDFTYETKELDVKKLTPAEVRTKRTEIYRRLQEDLNTIVLFNTSDKNLKQAYGLRDISDYALIPENDKKAVKDNISYFETLLSARLALDRILPEEHIEQFLFNKDKELDSPRTINRKISFLNNQRTLENKAHHKRDREAQQRLKSFIKNINSCREPPEKSEIEEYLRQINVIDIPLNFSYNIADFIAANTNFMYDNKRQRYISQSDNPERKAKLIEKWMLPILNQENTKKKSARQLVIPFKDYE